MSKERDAYDDTFFAELERQRAQVMGYGLYGLYGLGGKPVPPKDPKPAECPHKVPVAGEEIEACVEEWRGGSWQEFWARMNKRGFCCVKVRP